MYQLVILRDGQAMPACAIEGRAVHLGRGDVLNDVVLATDPSVSWQHAMVWADGTGVWVRDLGSSNGTWVNESRVWGPVQIFPGDHVRLGAGTIIELRCVGEELQSPWSGSYILEDVAASLSFPLLYDRFTMGSDPGCDLRLETGPSVAATLLIHADGEIRLGTVDDDRASERREVFVVEGREFRIRKVDSTKTPTARPVLSRYQLRVQACLDGPTGPEAVVEDPETGRRFRCEINNRATLLYVLAHAFAEGVGKAPDDRGWCSDEVVMQKIWGRHGDANKLHVLLHRLRADLREAGFDPWFVEKRQRYVRIRVGEVSLQPLR